MRLRANKTFRRVKIRWKESKEASLPLVRETADATGVGAWPQHSKLQPRMLVLESPAELGAWNLKLRIRHAFTIVELLVVVAIIALLAGLALPHMGGLTKSNSMTAATRQMLDDVAYARQEALLNRTTVYMVFVPPEFWNWGVPANSAAFNKTIQFAPDMTNLVAGQYAMYALLTLHSVGDQPGRSYPNYLTSWRRLPEGVTIAREKFFQIMSVLDTNSSKQFSVFPFASTNVPFPSIQAATAATTTFQLPFIAFGPSGGLTTNQDDYIPLTRASVFYPQTNGIYILSPPDWAEIPPGNSTNDYHLIHINWLTGRAKLERKEIQ